jgi:hypothetical protein
MNMLDLETIFAEETSVLHLKDATGDLLYVPGKKETDDKLPVTVTVYGPASAQFAKAQAKRSSKAMALLRQPAKTVRSPDDVAKDAAEFLTAITHSFENISFKGLTGAELFNAVYLERKLGFIADQVNEHVGEWENFSKGSAKS